MEEPDEPKAIGMMQGGGAVSREAPQGHDLDDAVRDAVRLSRRYLTGRQLPDKSVSVLDTACARVAIGLTTSPPAVEEATRRIGQIERELQVLERETLMGRDHAERIKVLANEKETAQARLEGSEHAMEAGDGDGREGHRSAPGDPEMHAKGPATRRATGGEAAGAQDLEASWPRRRARTRWCRSRWIPDDLRGHLRLDRDSDRADAGR